MCTGRKIYEGFKPRTFHLRSDGEGPDNVVIWKVCGDLVIGGWFLVPLSLSIYIYM